MTKIQETLIKGAAVAVNTDLIKTQNGSDILNGFQPSRVESSSIKKDAKYIRLEVWDGMNNFVQMLHRAFAEHKPIVIKPDNLWLLITQGFSCHINIYAEKFRHSFVDFEGKKTLEIRDDFELGVKKPWEEVFSEFSKQIESFTKGTIYKDIVLDFSTTTFTEKAALEISFLESMDSYFSLTRFTACGIPSIRLMGSKEDYTKILNSLQKLRKFDLDLWVDILSPIIEKIIASIEGKKEPDFWNSIFKVDSKSGDCYITGWINAFFPYVISKSYTAFRGGIKLEDDNQPICLRKIKTEEAHIASTNTDVVITTGLFSNSCFHENPDWLEIHPTDDLSMRGAGLTTEQYPNGLSQVPLKWNNLGKKLDMQLIAGHIGITENPENNELEAEINWVILEKG